MPIPTPSKSMFRALWRDRSGAYSIVTAVMMPVLVGFAGFGTEAGLWYFDHQKMQGAADAAAYSADLAYNLGNTSTFQTEAKAVATTISQMSRSASRMAKEAVTRAFESTLTEGLLYERRLFHSAFATEDQSEGMAAFIDKRPPNFSHR